MDSYKKTSIEVLGERVDHLHRLAALLKENGMKEEAENMRKAADLISDLRKQLQEGG